MSSRNKFRIVITAIILVFLSIALADSMHVFNTKPYVAVPHGNQIHYVPKNRDPSVPIDSFPLNPPGPGERITPKGKIIVVR